MPEKTIRIGNLEIGPGHPPLIVAEMSGNHNQSLDRALEIVDAAARTGAHMLKIQTYTADTMTIDKEDGEFRINDPKSLWNGHSLHKLYRLAHTPWEWHAPIFERCRERGMLPFSTPFDATAVDFLEAMDVPVHKIASFENTDLPLLRKVGATGKPVIVSTGMATVAELEETVKTLRGAGNDQIILLKCTSSYPATPEFSNVLTIPHLRDLFGTLVGLSDHTLGVGASVTSVALGACLIEKHFTLARADGGVDSAFSMEEAEMKNLVEETFRGWQSLGRITYGPGPAEKGSLIFRRSLYVVKDVKAGERFDAESVRAIRPGYGLPTKFLETFLGRRAGKDIKRGTALSWDLLG